jgi:putative transposase
MKRSRFTEEQIIGVLEEHQAGVSAADICRRHGISEATFYTWRSKYGGLEVSEARRLKALEEENAKLKKLLAETATNGFVESFNGRFRDECLDEHLFSNLTIACRIIEAWRIDDNPAS